ncbi:MAG: hypothetical protein VZS44_04500 [Bacilli bacterium]|nr:hypothetical protein [Bacilli bacterium]
MDKKNIKLTIATIITIIIIFIATWLVSNKKVEEKDINVFETRQIADNNDPVIRDIYHQFNPEEDILFYLLGSGKDKKYYGYYYQKDKVSFNELDDVVKTYLTINSFDYKNAPVNSQKNCYQVKKEDLNITFEKLFNQSYLKIDNSIDRPKIDDDGNNICIYDNNPSDYIYTLDTSYINATYQDNQLIIYEKVAFIKLNENNLEFYSDYEMQDLIYKANRTELDLSFLNNLNITSNVLTKYQDKFNIYTYTFTKNEEHYYFESVSK